MPLQIRRGTNAERQAITPAAGELIFVTNTNQLFVGNGSTPGGIVVTNYTDLNAQDAAAAIFTANNPAHSSINFAYNTSTNLITAAVDLSDYQGVIKANAFKGSVFADDGSTVGGTELVNAVDGSINLNGTVKGHIVPDVNVAYDLGSASLRFRDLYLSGSSIELGAATITATGSVVNLPAGSTVDGVVIGTGSGGGNNDDYSGNIIGDDSSIIVNTSNNSITVEEASVNTVLNVDNIIGDDFNGVKISANGTVPLSINGIGTLGIASGQVYFTINAAKGTLVVPTTSAAGDVLGGIAIQGYDGSDYKAAGLIAAGWDATATLLDQNPRSLISLVSYGGGTTIRFATLDYLGVWSAPLQKTTVYSNAGIAIPAAATVGAGARAFVSDATTNTFATAYTGGGANSVPVYSDGTSWYIG